LEYSVSAHLSGYRALEGEEADHQLAADLD
jgi:hypothetical protein